MRSSSALISPSSAASRFAKAASVIGAFGVARAVSSRPNRPASSSNALGFAALGSGRAVEFAQLLLQARDPPFGHGRAAVAA